MFMSQVSNKSAKALKPIILNLDDALKSAPLIKLRSDYLLQKLILFIGRWTHLVLY